MAKAQPKLTLSPSRDIPFDKIVLSQSNVRRVVDGVSLDDLADDIDRRGLLQGLSVRPIVDGDGQETGMFEAPAGGRRYRALEILVKRKRMARNALVPCVVKAWDDSVSAEEDSLAENTFREALHPLDEFRGMQALSDKGQGVEAIAAVFKVTPAVVRQRQRLASVSPKLHEVYAQDGMTLDQLMAFSVSDDHERQERVWEMLAHSINRSPAFIRARLTESTVRASDPRALFVGVDAYVEAGGGVLRDLFEPDDGGWLQDAALLDRLAGDKLQVEGERIGAEGWKWVAVAVDLPYGYLDALRELDAVEAPLTETEQAQVDALEAEAEALNAQYDSAEELPDEVAARLTAIDEALDAIMDRPEAFDPSEMAHAGAFVSLDVDGTLYIERGWVRPEDEPEEEPQGEAMPAAGDVDEPDAGFIGSSQPGSEVQRAVIQIGRGAPVAETEDEEEDIIRPLPDRLVSELTAHRTIALQDAFAQNPSVAFAAVLHTLVLSTFYYGRTESCLGLSMTQPSFVFQAPGLKDSASARSIADRQKRWDERLPESDKDLWDAIQQLDSAEQADLFAHCAAHAVNALWEAVPKYDNGRVSAHSLARRIEHSHVLARAVGLDMVGAGWAPTVENYLGRVTKPRILQAVAEAKGEQTAGLIDHLKKADMAREAERLLVDAAWLPEPLRTPVTEAEAPTEPAVAETDAEAEEGLPAFLDDGEAGDVNPDEALQTPAHAIAAE
jgi:ParB family chromosome partitioning protein